jgi:phospholipid/cholesterol/gamma-HCH transport system substrate-binding protein
VVGVVVLLAVTLVVIASVLLRGGSQYEVRALVESAGQLVKGNLVKVGGVTVGTVHAIDLTSDNQAQITLRIDDPRFKPLHQGTIATIRNTSLSSVAGRQVALQPGPNSNPRIDNHGAIKGEDTRPIVDLDQLLNTLDAQARSSLQELVHGGAVAFGSHPKQADAALAALNPALSQAHLTVQELAGDQATFERALVESAGVVSSVAARAGDLQAGVANGAQVADAVASESQSLDTALRRAPDALRTSNTTLAELRSALTGLRPALRDAQPAAPRLANVLRLAQPVVHEAGPVVSQVRAVLPDVTAILLGLPKLDATARPAFASTAGALQGASEVVQAARTYAPDLVGGLLNGFGGSTGPYYDANGHYVRIALAGNITSFSNAGSLLPTPPRSTGNDFRSGIVNRCPGAASQPAPDRSNPFAPPEAQCNPKDSP